MIVYHIRNNHWVKHRAITRKLTFASPIEDAILLCKQDYAKLTGHNIDLITTSRNGPFLHCNARDFLGTPRKVYRLAGFPLAYPDRVQEYLC